MCTHGEFFDICPLCDPRTSFTRVQIAFLEDLLINRCCMSALEKGKSSREPDKCRQCAENIFHVVEQIRDLRE